MSIIRTLTEDDLEEAIRISTEAYPGNPRFTPTARLAERERLVEQMERPGQSLWGLERDEKLLGIMKLYDFTMNFGGTPVPVGGLGGVAVDLLHKKEKVARDMIDFYLRHYRQRGTYWAALYPFRPDFYRRMGFGWGTKSNSYEIRPVGFPGRGDKSRLRFLTEEDAPAVAACYQRAYERTHGYFARRPDAYHFQRLFDDATTHLVGVFDKEDMKAYLAYTFERVEGASFLHNDLQVVEFIYDTPAALHAILTFFRSQLDQIQRIRWSTQDENLHYLLLDPRNRSQEMVRIISHPSNVQATGIMYRVLDVGGALEQLQARDFSGETMTLGIVVHDSFVRENTGRTVIRFEDGQPHVDNEATPEITIEMEIGDFSSLLVGSISFRGLWGYGLAGIDDPSAVPRIDALFRQPQKPQCVTGF
jgi:predicted acetyltransferase